MVTCSTSYSGEPNFLPAALLGVKCDEGDDWPRYNVNHDHQEKQFFPTQHDPVRKWIPQPKNKGCSHNRYHRTYCQMNCECPEL